jgi:hypothetical protein
LSFSSSHEREAFVEKYGELHSGILEQCLGIITATANRVLSETEARTKALAIFEELMQRHVPACHATVAEYQAKVNAHQKAEADARVAYMDRQERIRAAEAKFQQESAEAADRANRAAQQEEARQAKEYRQQFEAEQRMKQAEKDREEAERAEALEKRLKQSVAGQE